jgi:hypothetical protein
MSTIKPKKIEPGSELHFALLGAPMGWNFLTGKDYADMQAFAKAVWDAATERAAKLCDEHGEWYFENHNSQASQAADACAEAIRGSR